MTIKYALVAGKICEYVDGTVTRVPNKFVDGVIDIEWKDARGVTNVVAGEENFITGSYDELVDVVRKERAKIEEDVFAVLERFSHPSINETAVIRLMVEDGEELDSITPERVSTVLKGMFKLRDVCNSMEEAYMCYMH